MSQSPSTIASEAYSESKQVSKTKKGGSLFLGLTPLFILYAVAVLLYALTSQGLSGAFRYWEIFIPVVALISLAYGWSQAYLMDNSRLWYLIKQVAHWGGLIALVYVLNTQGIRMLMNDQQYTILLVYLLAFATLLAAVNLDIRQIFFAAFMVYCAFLIAVPANNPALVAIGERFGIADAATKPFMVTLGVAFAGLVASYFIIASMRGAIVAKQVRARG